MRGVASVSSTRAGAFPLKQQSKMHRTARAFVAMNVSASAAIGKVVAERSSGLVSNTTKPPSRDP